MISFSNMSRLLSGKSGSKCAPTTETTPCGRTSSNEELSADRRARCLDHGIRADAAGRGGDRLGGLRRLDGDGAELLCKRAPCAIPSTAITLRARADRAEDGHQTDGPAAEHDDDVPATNARALDCQKAGRQDVGDEHRVLVADVGGDRP